MDKLAQERGVLNRLREKANITGRILESLNPEFQEMMDKLRATDEQIRERATDVKSNIRAAKSYLNRRDYLSAASNISAFHEKCRYVVALLDKFIKGVDLKHYKFLLDQFDDEQKEQLFGYDPNKSINVEEDTAPVSDHIVTAALTKQAGVSDWWFKMTDPIADLAHNLTQDRAIAMRALEKRFSIAFLKDLKLNTATMVTRAQRFLSILITSLKRLATALAKRNIDQYVSTAKNLIAKFAGFHQQFMKYYNASIVPLKDQHEKLQEEKRKVEEAKSREMEEAAAKARGEPAPATTPIEQKQFTMPLPPAGRVPVIDRRRPTGTPVPISTTPEKGFSENLRDALSKEPTEDVEETPIPLTKRKAEFISRIEKIADPKDLMLEILDFSEDIEKESIDDSLRLIAIAEGIAEDYKTAGIFDFMSKKPVSQPQQPQPAKKDEPDPLA